MMNYTSLISVALGLYIIHNLVTFLRNIHKCRQSKIPYTIVPFQPHGILALVTSSIWHPLLSYLPSTLKGPWTLFMDREVHWKSLYAPFRLLNADTVLVCSPGQIVLHTAGADVVTQITERKEDFPKPTWMYGIINIYGKSVISVERLLWRKHRKVTGVTFTEKNSKLVWGEGITQAQDMLGSVVGDNRVESRKLTNLEEMMSRLALGVISRAGYGVKTGWGDSLEGNDGNIENNEEDKVSKNEHLEKEWVEGKTDGHTLSYFDSLFGVSTHVLWLMILPKAILQYLPIQRAQKAKEAYDNWGQYMREMIAKKRETLDTNNEVKPQTSDLLASLVKSSRDHSVPEGTPANTNTKPGREGFCEEELLGNAFMIIVAGHETTAGFLHYALILLAMNVKSQRRLQSDIDSILQGMPASDWNFERDCSRLMAGMPGAVLAEVLRWLPSVPSIPKETLKDEQITIGNDVCTVPKGTVLAVNVPGAHRNPHQWPHDKPTRPTELEHEVSNPDDDLGEFKPERWLRERTEGMSDPDRTLMSMPRGTYLPFSEGSRACLGRRFAQVEIMAALAVIFQDYSVELAVDEWATDDEIAVMDQEQRKEPWSKARTSAGLKFRTCMQNMMSIKMTKGHVPLRFVKRGSERFEAEDW